MLVASSVGQGLRVHVSGRIPGTSGLDRSSGETWKTRVGGAESSPDSGSPEPVCRVVAANDCRFRQTSLCQQRDTRVPLQRCCKHDAQADHVRSVARNRMFITQNARKMSCGLRSTLDGPDRPPRNAIFGLKPVQHSGTNVFCKDCHQSLRIIGLQITEPIVE